MRNLILLSLSSLLLITACSSGPAGSSRYSMHRDRGPERDVNVSHIPDAIPRAEPRSRYGNPASYTVNGQRYFVKKTSQNYLQRGVASWYGKKFHGHRTSSGETYDMYAMTAAHKTLPLPTYVRVTHLQNGRSVVVKVNDRGPFHDNRLIDLSYVAAKKLGITANGTGVVEVAAIDPFNQRANKKTFQHKAVNQPLAAVQPAQPHQADQYNLYLQVGAFVSRSNAEQLRQRLHQQFAALNINAGFNPEKSLYRVRIGPLKSVAEADALATRISNSGLANPHIVVD